MLDEKQIRALQEASGHSIFGSSSLPRIVLCPASVGEELKAGLKPESIYARKGSDLHGWMEKALKTLPDPVKYLMSKNISIEDTSYLIDCIEYFDSVISKHPKGEDITILLEEHGSLQSYGLPEVYGTMDVQIKSSKRIDVIDWKFGHGVTVSVKDNVQCISYLGMAYPYTEEPDNDMRKFVHIVQPPKNIFEEEEISNDKLYNTILGAITNAINEARSNSPAYNPSIKACKFCGANMRCFARHKWLQEQAKAVQTLANDPAYVSNEKWALYLQAAEAVQDAISKIKSHAMSEIMAGRNFPGYKIVCGRANRKFVDEEKGKAFIIKKLGSKAYKPSELVTLVQAEKINRTLKNDPEWGELIYTPIGSPSLVPVSEPGKAMVYGTKSIFDSIASGKI